MLNEFIAFISKEKLFNANDRILLAVSGGVDSMVMADLFSKTKWKFGIAHINFSLRGKESDGDVAFVGKAAANLNVPFYSRSFETTEYAAKKKISIQMAAREIRYKYLEKIRSNEGYDYIVTAHHSDDSLETVLLNLTRGTGISGLHGILPKVNKIVRPMLFANRKQIIDYAIQSKIAFREDSSNNSDDYQRNKIRHHVIPVLKEINPSLNRTMNENISGIRDVELIYRTHVDQKRSENLVRVSGNDFIDLKELFSKPHWKPILFELLFPFGFTKSVIASFSPDRKLISGKTFFSSTHKLTLDRSGLIIEKLGKKQNTKKNTEIYPDSKSIQFGKMKLKVSVMDIVDYDKLIVRIKKSKSSTAYFNFEKLEFPLIVRHWKAGDYFYPFGTKGKKKLSDFFIDNKIPVPDKNEKLVLCSSEQIAWIVGMRTDNRFAVSPKTKKVFKVELR